MFTAWVLTAQTPAPGPTALPEIGRTHSKGFCAAVRDNVAPSLLGLMKNDALIGASHRAMAKMADDSAHGTREGQDMDRLYADRVVVAMAHNLALIKKLLADENRFPKTAVSDDDRYALLLKAQLQAAADRQADALNHVNGILETTAMGNMRNDISTQMAVAAGSATAHPSTTGPGDQFLDVATIPGTGPGGTFGHAGPGSSSLGGKTIWDKLVLDIEVQQTRVAAAEQQLSPTIIAASIACRSDGPAPTPAP